MVNRLVSADENHNVPDNLNIRDVNLPDRLQDTALNATIGDQIATGIPQSAFKGAAAYSYGTSWYASNAGSTVEKRAINQVAARLGLTLTNYALNGSRVQDMAARAINKGGTYAPGTSSIIIGDFGLFNNQGADDTAQTRDTAAGALRALIATLCASERIEETAGTYSAGWTSATSDAASGGSYKYTSTGVTHVDFTVPAGRKYLLLRGTDGVAVAGMKAEVFEGPGAKLRNTFLTNQTTYNTTYNAEGLGPVAFDVSHIPAGTMRVRSGWVTGPTQGLYVDAILPQSKTPPIIVLVKQVQVPGHWTDKPALFEYLRSLPDQMRAEFGDHIIVADPAPGWDQATMLGPDQLHPNDKGMDHVRDSILSAINAETSRRARQQLLPGVDSITASQATQAARAVARSENVTRRLGALLNTPPVASRGIWPHTLSNGTDTAMNAHSRHILTSDVTEVRLVYVNANTPAGAEAGPGNQITVTSSIELSDGSFLPVTFRGARPVVIESGAFAVSDPVTLDLPKGTAIRSRTYVTVASGKFPRGHKGSFVGTMGDGAEIGLSGSITDKTMVAGNLASASAIDMYGPTAILGKGPYVWDSPSIGLFGDSIQWGQGSESNTRVGQSGPGFGAIALNNNFNFINVGDPGDRATITSVRANHSLRWQALQGCTHVISNFGVNDLSNGVTLADYQAACIAIWTQLGARGAKVWQTTITPVTTSTDGWLTAANQTAGSFGAINPANLWYRDGAPMLNGAAVATGSNAVGTLRAGAAGHPLAGIFDVAAAVTTADGKWKDAIAVVSRTGLSGTSGSTTLTAATSQFTVADDRYKRIIIPGAGAGGGLYVGQIAAYTSGTSVTLSPALGATVSGVSGTVFDPMTNDGVHPFNPGADLMATAVNTSLLTL